jgi:hypothetical protein
MRKKDGRTQAFFPAVNFSIPYDSSGFGNLDHQVAVTLVGRIFWCSW